MPTIAELFRWWNAIYTAPLLFALLYMALANLLGVFAAGGEGGDAEADMDVEVEAEAGDDGGPAHAEAPHGVAAAFQHLLALFGFGRAPVALIVEVWLLLWGAIGLAIHSVASRGLPPGTLLAISMPVTFISATLLTRALAGLIGKYLPPVQSFAWSRQQFVGKTGEVVYPVTGEAGTVHLRDGSGTIHRVRARSAHEALEPGRRIIVLGYDPETDLYTVDDAVKFVERKD